MLPGAPPGEVKAGLRDLWPAVPRRAAPAASSRTPRLAACARPVTAATTSSGFLRPCRAFTGNRARPGRAAHASCLPGATSLTRDPRPIHPRRVRNGRDGTNDVHSDASPTLDEQSCTTPDTRKPGPQGAGWYIRKL